VKMNMEKLTEQVVALQARLEALEQEHDTTKLRLADSEAHLADTEFLLKTSQQKVATALRRMKVQAGLGLCALIGALWFTPLPQVMAKGYDTLAQDVQTLKIKTQYITADNNGMIIQDPYGAKVDIHGPDVKVIHANLWVQNGLGATNGNPNDPYGIYDWKGNGLGNLIIGYDEPPPPPSAIQRIVPKDKDAPKTSPPANSGGKPSPQFRIIPFPPPPVPIPINGASHNLIMGVGNTRTSFAGIVVGMGNAITAPFATITGGHANTASGVFSSVSGGDGNNESAWEGWAAGFPVVLNGNPDYYHVP
jgi:hypothetical protein